MTKSTYEGLLFFIDFFLMIFFMIYISWALVVNNNYRYDYTDDYEYCIKELPRNLDCKIDKINFVVVNSNIAQ